MFNQGGLIVQKKEMTRVAVDGVFLSVTILKIPSQKVVRHKKQDVDGYDALVLGLIDKNDSVVKQKEFHVTADIFDLCPAGYLFDSGFLENTSLVSFQGISKGKGFAGVIKRHHMSGMPATHGHKFTRVGGSKGNRKPRRGFKGHPHAGHMGSDMITLKNISVLKQFSFEGDSLLVIRGSLPGSYNSYLYLYK